MPVPVNIERLHLITGEDPEAQRELIELFLDDTGQRMRRLEEALVARNWALMGIEAHTVKGASSNMGADSLQVAIALLEKAVKGQQAPEIQPLLEKARLEFLHTADFFLDYLKTLPEG